MRDFHVISQTSSGIIGLATMRKNPKARICISLSELETIVSAMRCTKNDAVMLSIYSSMQRKETASGGKLDILGFHLPLCNEIDETVPIVVCAGRVLGGFSDSLINQSHFCESVEKDLMMKKIKPRSKKNETI